MQITLNGNTLNVFYTYDELSQVQKNQIRYYGFIHVPNQNRFQQSDDGIISMALKIIAYCDRQAIHYSLSDNLIELRENQLKMENAFMEVKLEAANYKNGIFNKKNFDSFCCFVNMNIKRKLKEHQIKAAYHHWVLKNAANFSVPGSGKTTTLITVYEKLKQEKTVNTLFVVGPLSSFTAWKNEYFQTLGKNAKICILSNYRKQERLGIYYEDQNDIDLFLTTFQTFSNDYKNIKKFFLHNNIFLVIDEAHYIKQIDGKWSSKIIDASVNAKAKYVLTGTPCPKGYTDLFNLFDFLWGKNNTISEHEKAQIYHYEKNKEYKKAQVIIKNKFGPLFYRVRKTELGLTKPVFHDPIILKMNPIERNIYDRIFRRISELSYFDGEKNFMTLLNLKRGRIIRLRQMMSYTKLLRTAIDNYEENLFDNMNDISNLILNYDKYEKPSKLIKLLDLINTIQHKDKKIVIWTNFLGTIALIEKKLKKNEINCSHITGSTPTIEKQKNILTREQIINEFLSENSSIDVLIANPGACAESISLHKTCYHAIYYDLSYNCAQYLQSLDRIHRVGGSEVHKANYYFLQYENTIDSDILDNLFEKRNKMYDIIENNSDIFGYDISAFIDIEEDKSAYDRIFKNNEF